MWRFSATSEDAGLVADRGHDATHDLDVAVVQEAVYVVSGEPQPAAVVADGVSQGVSVARKTC